jgi:hypothetical protein
MAPATKDKNVQHERYGQAKRYSDVVTPYAVNKYVVDHLPETVASRVKLNLYRGGYFTRPSHLALS